MPDTKELVCKCGHIEHAELCNGPSECLWPDCYCMNFEIGRNRGDDMEHFQLRFDTPCNTCGKDRFITVMDTTEGGCAAQQSHEKRKGICLACERKLPETEAVIEQAKAKRQFYRCAKCHKPVHLAARDEHDAKHAQNAREWARARNHPITQAHRHESRI